MTTAEKLVMIFRRFIYLRRTVLVSYEGFYIVEHGQIRNRQLYELIFAVRRRRGARIDAKCALEQVDSRLSEFLRV